MSDAVQETIISIIQDIKNTPIDPSEALIDNGVLDSFDIINLIMALENTFAINIPGEEIVQENLGYVDDIAKLVRAQQLRQ